MPNIEIYTSPFCPFCHRAKALLAKKSIPFTEIDVFTSPGKRREMMERADGRRTVPQLFIDGIRIGDCDEIHALDSKGELDTLLSGGAVMGLDS